MNKAAAMHAFLSSFGIPAYADTSVPDAAQMPYLTYTLAVGAFGDGELNVTVNLWYRTESEAAPNAKVEEISERISFQGSAIACDGGMVWIKRGAPFAQAVADEDNSIKRRMLNLSVEYLTEN